MASEISVDNTAKVLLKDVSICPEWSNSKPSFAWKYFGKMMICNKNRSVYKANKVFCTECLATARKRSKNLNDLLDSFSSAIKCFSEKTSTGNLTKHLSYDHKIVDTVIVTSKSLQTMHSFFDPITRDEQKNKLLTVAQRKRKLVCDIVLLCCRDLLPFDIVNGEGWSDFCNKYDIVADPSDMPHRTSISRTLDFVYQHCKAEVIKAINESSPENVSMTSDQWTDKYRRRPYNTATLHYWDDCFDAINLTLKTSHFPKKHTGKNILAELENVIEEFGLQEKSIHMVTDAARNARKACRDGNYDNHLCLGHGMHNSVYTDGVKKTEDVLNLTRKVRNIVKALRYKTNDFQNIPQEMLSLMEKMTEVSEIDPYFDDEDVRESDNEEVDSDEECSADLNTVKSLKLDVVTRWYSTLIMMESVKSRGRHSINVVLQKYDKDDLCLSQSEFKLIEELCKFWDKFQKISKMLSGETYSTVNMVCLFRSEIASLLEEDGHDLSEIAELKKNMLQNFDKRFPMNDLVVVGALLDPRCQHLLDVKTYLTKNRTSAFDLLKKWAKAYVPVSTSTNSNNTNEDNANFMEELLEKHSTLNYVRETMRTEADLDREIYLLLSLGGNVKLDSIRMFWKSHAKQMPLLSILAKKVLSIPMTSTPSERNFSLSGLTVNSRRSSVLPSNLDKILFMHNNYQFCKKIALKTLRLDDLVLEDEET